MFKCNFPVVLALKPFKDVLVEIYSHRRKAGTLSVYVFIHVSVYTFTV